MKYPNKVYVNPITIFLVAPMSNSQKIEAPFVNSFATNPNNLYIDCISNFGTYDHLELVGLEYNHSLKVHRYVYKSLNTGYYMFMAPETHLGLLINNKDVISMKGFFAFINHLGVPHVEEYTSETNN